jgi:chromosome transmission fidelity protein 18
MEVNASDERSANVLGDCIRRAMESTTINFQPTASDKLTQNRKYTQEDFGKPNCLILDEIDGADAKGAIQALVEIVRAEIPPRCAKHKNPYLRRPIICICNHKYAPALRPLLPYAVHFNVDPPSSARLVARLQAILNQERLAMMAGGSLLHQLVVSTGGDIRSCLFTLQFAASQAEDSKDLSNALSNSLSGSGLKDDRNDIASTVAAIFRKDKSSSSEKKFGTSGAGASGGLSSVSRVIDCVEGLSDDSAAINSMFMNVLRVSYIDPAFDRCAAVHELLSASDFHGGDGATEFYSMQKICTPPLAAGIHLLCRVEVKPSLTISTRELADIQYRKETNLGLVQKFSEGLPARAKNLKCATILTEEVIPLALWVLSAGEGSSSLRRAASSIDILSNMERETANAHVAVLCSLGLTYVQDHEFQHMNQKPPYRAGTPAVEMRLEPPIHRLVHYNSVGAPVGVRRKEIPSAMKELLAHQVRLVGFLKGEDKGSPTEEIKPTSMALMGAESSPPSSPGKGGKLRSNDTLSTPRPAIATPRKLEQLVESATIPEPKRIKVCVFGVSLTVAITFTTRPEPDDSLCIFLLLFPRGLLRQLLRRRQEIFWESRPRKGKRPDRHDGQLRWVWTVLAR